MNLENNTKNQHFISQIEQRLNAINPLATDTNQRIYEFKLMDRESHKISLESPRGVKINSTLCLRDLFSFEILETEKMRYNFEELFTKYESNIRVDTQSLLKKISSAQGDIKPELVNLFLSKIINFIRNPFSIKKVLNTFPQLKNLHPTNPIHYSNYKKVLDGRRPQQQYLSEQLEISQEEYADWLSIIFLLLTSFEENKPNLLEEIIKSLYENPNTYILIIIYTYENKTCLLSDRGYSTPLCHENTAAFDFNLCSKSFIRYVFGDIDSIAPNNIPKEIIDNFKSRPKSINIQTHLNDLDVLAQYNKHVVYQCFNTVFNSSIECYGL